MIRVADTGDWHVPEGPRAGDVLACLRALVADGIEQRVGLWAVKGDLAGITVPFRQTIAIRNALATIFQEMAAVAPLLVCYGNHDHDGDLEIFGRLSSRFPIYVVSEPTVIDVAGARCFVLPYPRKRLSTAVAGGVEIEVQDRAVENDLAGLFAAWKPQVDAARTAGIPTLCLGHAAVENCAMAGGEVLAPGQEIAVSVRALEELGCDYSSFSHPHVCQEMAPSIWLPGSPSRSTFAETDPKGYLIADVAPAIAPMVHRRMTPARPFVTVDVAWDAERQEFLVDDAPFRPAELAARGAEVRVRLSVPEEAAATCPSGALEQLLLDDGAVDVKLDRRLVPKTRIRSEAITTARTTAEKLAAYWASLATPPDAEQQRRCLEEKLPQLERMAA